MDLHTVLGGLPPKELVSLGVELEDHGIDGLWITDQRFHHDCFSLIGALAASTSRVELFTGVNDPYSRHPAHLAMAAATLDSISAGRFVLGLGAGGNGLDKMGVHVERPVATVTAAIEGMRALWRGETVSCRQAGFNMDRANLAAPPSRSIGIAMVSHGPRMYALAGELADVAVVANLATPEGIGWAFKSLDKGYLKRTVDARPRLVLRLDVAVSDDKVAAQRTIVSRVKAFLNSGYYGKDFLMSAGLEEGWLDAIQSPDQEESLDALSERVAEAVALFGDSQTIARHLGSLPLDQFGGLCLSPYPAVGQTMREAIEQVSAVFDQLRANQIGVDGRRGRP